MMIFIQFTRDFIEKSILLIATGVLTGFLIPFILKRIDEQKAKEQKAREAMLNRQTKLIDAQSQLLETVSKLLWDWRFLIMKVTYYGGMYAEEHFKAAKIDYDANLWSILNQIRFQTSRSRSLISEAVYKQLLAFYMDIISHDKTLQKILQLEDSVKLGLELTDFNMKIFNDVSTEIDVLINNLARDVNLSVNLKT
jgi:hypothetical protein